MALIISGNRSRILIYDVYLLYTSNAVRSSTQDLVDWVDLFLVMEFFHVALLVSLADSPQILICWSFVPSRPLSHNLISRRIGQG